MERADEIIKRFKKRRKKIIGVEVGVYKGSLSAELLRELPTLHLFMVDRWKSYSKKEFKQNKKTSMASRGQDTFDNAYEKACKIANKHPKRAKIIKLPSVKAAKLFKNRSLDFVFIDANHSLKAVTLDVYTWMPKIRRGGYLCGHDYHRLTVFRAVNKFFKDRIIAGADNTWFVKL